MRSLCQIAASLAMGSLAAAGALEDHRWKHRLLVVPAAAAGAVGKLNGQQVNLAERDVRVVRLEAAGDAPIQREIARRFGIDAKSREVLLIGKDGATTVRWGVDEFSFEKFFQRIDAMPMRMREMRERSRSE